MDIKLTMNNILKRRTKLRNYFLNIAELYDILNEYYRSIAYQRAADYIIDVLKVPDIRKAKETKFIGGAIQGDIDEYLHTGKISRYEQLRNSEKNKIIQKFLGILGIGKATAKRLADNGYKTIHQVLQYPNLLPISKIGIKYYNELNERFSRQEADCIIEKIRKILGISSKDSKSQSKNGKSQSKDSYRYQTKNSYKIFPLGSYRRGKQDIGDIDIMVIEADLSEIAEKIEQSSIFFYRIILGKKKYSFLISSPYDSKDWNSSNNKNRKRRVDIYNTSKKSQWTMMQYLTGSGSHNEYLRGLAKAKGIKLNEYGMYNIYSGKEYSINCEKDIYKIIGISYVLPAYRN